jgi:RimJ/RimL family protein N-acetyltransferase
MNFPELKTDRLILSQIQLSDVPVIAKYANNKKIVQFTRTMPNPYHEKDAIDWITKVDEGFKKKNSYIFAIRDKKTKHFMGGIGLTLATEHNRAELGYWLAEPFWNQGFTTEAVSPILKFGFQVLNLNKIVAMYIDVNIASGKILEKNFMIREAEMKEHDSKDGKYVTLIQYRLTKTEFEQLK